MTFVNAPVRDFLWTRQLDCIRDPIVIGNSLKLWTGYAHLRLLVAEVGLRSGKRTSDCGVTNLMIPRKIADLTFECFECHTHE